MKVIFRGFQIYAYNFFRTFRSKVIANQNTYIDDKFLYRDRFVDLTTTIICAFCHYDLLMNDDSSISFRQTKDDSVLKIIKNTISSIYPSKYSNILLNWAMIITWKDLFFPALDEEFKNTFQLVLTADENGQSFALFQYEKLNSL